MELPFEKMGMEWAFINPFFPNVYFHIFWKGISKPYLKHLKPISHIFRTYFQGSRNETVYLGIHGSQRVFISPFSKNPPVLWFSPFKKTLFPPFPIFSQTLNVVMLIASGKSQSARGISHQPAVMVSCLTISHTYLPCLPSRKVTQCVPGFTEVGSCCYYRKWVWSSRTKLCCMASGK